MKSSITSSLLSIAIFTTFLFTCAQRDNQHDPLSPLFNTQFPQLNVMITSIDTANVKEFIGDSQFIVIPPAKIGFKAAAYDVENKDSLPVLLKIMHNDKLVELYEDITSVLLDLNDSGVTTYVFETVNESRKSTQKEFKFVINPGIQPKINSFHTDFDTVRIGKDIDAMFTVNVIDSALLLDSIKYVYASTVQSKYIEDKKYQLYDTCYFSLFSSDSGEKEVLAIAIDGIGRSDTSRVKVVFNSVGKHIDKRHPNIQSINITTDDSIRFCFDPEVNIYNGNINNVEYSWYIGTSRFSRDQVACRTFGTAGMYDIFLRVEDEEGATAWDTIQLSVPKTSVGLPEIDSLITKPKSGSAPLLVKFNCVINSINVKEMRRITWDFGNGRTKIGSRSLSQDNRYDWPGTYYPKVIVCNDAGCDTISDTVVVVGSRYLKATPSENGKVGEEVKFYLESFKSRRHDFIWTIQDETFQTEVGVLKHVFNKPGEYKITVRGVNQKYPRKEHINIGEMVYIVTEN